MPWKWPKFTIHLYPLHFLNPVGYVIQQSEMILGELLMNQENA